MANCVQKSGSMASDPNGGRIAFAEPAIEKTRWPDLQRSARSPISSLREILDALSCLSLTTLKLAVRHPSNLRRYISECLKKYDELAGNGLPHRTPLSPEPDMTITIPAHHSGGGMSFDELVILARVTKVLNPRTVFEMGSYNGLTTAVFILNSMADARIITLDLPTTGPEHTPTLSSDEELVGSRQLVSIPQALGLDRYTQILCDSMQFEPSPYVDSVDLGLIDAAHDVVHVENDTRKMVQMMSKDGIVFWHDYGGKGTMRPLAAYLEALAKRCPLYRIRGTSLAWGPAKEIKEVLR
jgi:predicted O-methyltransferase YrrM